jgi:hypothetical protein
VVGVHHAACDVLAGRDAADHRLLREAAGAAGGREGRLRMARRGRRDRRADRRVLLPAHRQAHVFRRVDRSPIEARRHQRHAVRKRSGAPVVGIPPQPIMGLCAALVQSQYY